MVDFYQMLKQTVENKIESLKVNSPEGDFFIFGTKMKGRCKMKRAILIIGLASLCLVLATLAEAADVTVQLGDDAGVDSFSVLGNTTGEQAYIDSVGKMNMKAFQLGTSTTAGNVLTADASGVGTWAAPKEAFPVGSVFISVVSTNPATLLGYGTWAAFGTGRVLVGIDIADPDFDVVEETGGAKTQTPSAHTGVTVADHAELTHTKDTGVLHFETPTSNAGYASHPALVHTVTQPSDHAALSVVQPYIVVYMWKRTA